MVKKSDKPADTPEDDGGTATGALTWGSGGFTTDTASGTGAGEPEEPETAEPEEPETAEPVAKAKRGRRKAPKAELPEEKDPTANISVNTTELVSYVERIERVQEEIGEMKGDLKELFVEVKAKGYSAAILRKVLARRAMDPEKRREVDAMIELYEEALR